MRAAPELAAQIDETAVHLHQSPGDGQTEPRADALAAYVSSLEKLAENGLVVLRGDARTGIRNGDRHATVTRIHAHRDRALARELDGVAHDVADDLAYAPRVGVGHGRLSGQLQRQALGAGC